MARPCCASQTFVRHEKPAVADIGKAEGIEYTVGRCSSCGAWLIHGWMTAASAQSTRVVDQALIEKFRGAPAGPIRNKLLVDWENSSPDVVIGDAARPLWQRLRKPLPAADPTKFVWGIRLSPFFPEGWPPPGDGRLVCYAYGFGRPVRRAESEHIAAPWARIAFGLVNGSVLAIETLSEELRDIGAQRVTSNADTPLAWPLRNLDCVRCGGMPRDADTEELRSYYGTWRTAHGVIAQRIGPRHQEFFRWIDAR